MPGIGGSRSACSSTRSSHDRYSPISPRCHQYSPCPRRAAPSHPARRAPAAKRTQPRMLSRSASTWSSHGSALAPDARLLPAPRVDEVRRVLLSDHVRFTAGGQPVGSVLPDRLQHREAGLVVWLSAWRTRFLSTSEVSPSKTSTAALPLATASAASSVQPPGEDAQAAKEHALLFTQQVMAPGDRSAQRLLPLGQILGPSRQQGRRRSSRARRAAGERILMRAAASSRASGKPSSCRQISATAGALSSVSAKSALASCARATNSCTAGTWAISARPCGCPQLGRASGERAFRARR